MIDVRAINVFIGENQVLHEVSCSVAERETVAVIGANGAGKTSLIRTLLGLLPYRGGTVRVAGCNLAGLKPHQIADRLGLAWVPEGRRVFKGMTVRENLELGAYRKAARGRLKAGLDWVCSLFPVLQQRLAQRAGTLSGGEQQMLAIGRALMARPNVLLIDELSLGLAPLVVKEIYQRLQDIRREVTLVLVEQNVEQALKHSDRAYVLETGRVVQSAPSTELLSDPQVRAAYLGL